MGQHPGVAEPSLAPLSRTGQGMKDESMYEKVRTIAADWNKGVPLRPQVFDNGSAPSRVHRLATAKNHRSFVETISLSSGIRKPFILRFNRVQARPHTKDVGVQPPQPCLPPGAEAHPMVIPSLSNARQRESPFLQRLSKALKKGLTRLSRTPYPERGAEGVLRVEETPDAQVVRAPESHIEPACKSPLRIVHAPEQQAMPHRTRGARVFLLLPGKTGSRLAPLRHRVHLGLGPHSGKDT